MDYRRFLKAPETLVLPYFGGTRVDTATQRLRIGGGLRPQLEPGWWTFHVIGRVANPVDRAAPIDLSDRPAVRGHWAEGWLFSSGRDAGRIALPPDEEPAPLARCTARRWHSGDLLLDSIDFEDDAEASARLALEERRAIGDLRGVVPSLRAAFGFALAAAIGRELHIPVSPREALPQALAIADGGRDAAVALLRGLSEERAREGVRDRIRRVTVRRREGSPENRADAALAAADCRLLSLRRAGEGMIEVRWEVDGERIISVVDADSLHVYDAGICLAGADEELTLDSLPSVVREAIATDALNITRHG